MSGRTLWKVYGPDTNGRFGGLQGTGGLEAVILDADGTTTGVINDQFGNGVATVSGTGAGATVTWNTTRVGAYGPLPGIVPQTLTDVTQLAAATAWRSHRIDPTGFYYLGARYYEPTSGRFLSADPMGQSSSPSLYDYAGGDPVNRTDPDGRCADKLAQFMSDPIGNAGLLNDIYADLKAINDFNSQSSATVTYGSNIVDKLNSIWRNYDLERQQNYGPEEIVDLTKYLNTNQGGGSTWTFSSDNVLPNLKNIFYDTPIQITNVGLEVLGEIGEFSDRYIIDRQMAAAIPVLGEFNLLPSAGNVALQSQILLNDPRTAAVAMHVLESYDAMFSEPGQLRYLPEYRSMVPPEAEEVLVVAPQASSFKYHTYNGKF